MWCVGNVDIPIVVIDNDSIGMGVGLKEEWR